MDIGLRLAEGFLRYAHYMLIEVLYSLSLPRQWRMKLEKKNGLANAVRSAEAIAAAVVVS